ncbi:helix-turn-helix transcriptional regulator [Chitinophaga sp. Mgbs1]|uniref:Helix-turn-helix transcriptional regulator n=1 Tax=Chitinophaga solisilvae TaxID=1233460 RepID=A0A3S1JJW9_9BACT|nr:helix-turn-helix transcriptional regulator [Chitinophaga solisilvae]
MTVVIRNEAKEVLLEEPFPFASDRMASKVIIEGTSQLERDFGSYRIHELCFDGIQMAICNAEVRENLSITTDEIDRHVTMMFMQRGDVSTSIEGLTRQYRFSSLQHNLLFTPESMESANVKKQEGIRFYGLSLTPERFLELAENNGGVLGRLADKVAGNRKAILVEKANPPITPRMSAVLAEISQCGFSGGLKKLFLQSKLMELLALQCEQSESVFLNGNVVSRPVKISTREVDQLHHARELLLQDLGNPPTLSQLARSTGLNEFKLKSGFKTVFDSTVFGYLNDYRLNMAKELILTGDKPLSQIAYDAGYSSPQHFSTAFRKKFGVSPVQIRKK